MAVHINIKQRKNIWRDTMLHLAICDDHVDQIKIIRSAVELYTDKLNIEAVISEYNNPMVFLDELEQTGGYDILLLDICMPGILGTEVAKEIRRRGDKTDIIFLTFSDEFAVAAFTLKAVHYLIKPFTQAQYDEVMERAVGKYINGQVKNITLKLEKGLMQSIDLNDILYIESARHSQNIYKKNGICIEARHSLTWLTEELEKVSPGQFISPYKGYLVNQKAIRTIEPKQIVLLSGVYLPLSRGSYRQLQEAFFDYQFREGVYR
jgi:DNA-binding LytR/AlgR family response regulator